MGRPCTPWDKMDVYTASWYGHVHCVTGWLCTPSDGHVRREKGRPRTSTMGQYHLLQRTGHLHHRTRQSHTPSGGKAACAMIPEGCVHHGIGCPRTLFGWDSRVRCGMRWPCAYAIGRESRIRRMAQWTRMLLGETIVYTIGLVRPGAPWNGMAAYTV